MKPKTQHPVRRAVARICALALVALALGAGIASAFGQTTNIITLLTNDDIGTSSFTGSTNWSNGQAPGSGTATNFYNAYFTSNNILRTPTGAGSAAFAGDSLSIDTNGTLSVKGSGTVTVGNLQLNSGTVVNNGTGGTPDTAVLAGNITVNTNSILDGGSGAGTTTLNIPAPITGAAGLTIQDAGTVELSGSNSYAGQTTVNAGVLKINNATAIPLTPGGNLRVNNGATSFGTVDMNGFDVTAQQLITGNAAAFNGLVTNTATTPGLTNLLTTGAGDTTSYTFRGLIRENSTGTGGKIAFSMVSSGNPGQSVPPPYVFTLSLGTTNLMYSGDTTISNVVVSMGASLMFPAGPGRGNMIITNGGIIDMQGRTEVFDGLLGNGTIDNFAGNGVGLGGHSTVHAGSNDVNSTFSGLIQNTYYTPSVPNNDYVQLMKWGAGTLTLTGTNTYAGNVTINNGTLRITSQNGDGVTGGGLGLGSGTTPPTKLVVLNSATSELDFPGTNGNITVDPTIGFQTAGSIVSDAGNNEIAGLITLRSGGGTAFIVNAGTLTLVSNITIITNVSARALTLGGAGNGGVGGIVSDGTQITNVLSLAKEGAGTWTLSNANTYSGSTTISNGTLALGPSGSISSTTNISLQGGTLNVAAIAGSWTFAQAQTLSGFGAVTGNVTADGTVAPGGPGTIGTLTFANQLSLAGSSATFLALNRTNTPSNADKIAVATLVRGGTLTVTNGGDPLQGGDSFTLFSAASASGSFTATNLPALSSTNLFWDTSLFGGQGIIKVGSHVAAQPHITSIVLAGTTLTISGTNGTGGNQFAVLTSTNVGTPLSLWKPLVTNTFTGGNFSVPITVNPAAPQNYYILRTP